MSTLRQKHRVLSIGLAMDEPGPVESEPGPAGCAGAVGRILGGLQSSNLEKRERERERGMNNASLTRTWAHARPVRIAPRIPPAIWNLVWDVWSMVKNF